MKTLLKKILGLDNSKKSAANTDASAPAADASTVADKTSPQTEAPSATSAFQNQPIKSEQSTPKREPESDLMIYEGKAISVQDIGDGIVELKFDNQNESVNKFDQVTLADLDASTKAIAESGAKGVVVTSGKDVFIVGADITEFGAAFASPKEELLKWIGESNAVFNAFEDLGIPTAVAINGIALGGGLEMCLACDFRIMGAKAKIGLPEVQLGIFPGFGGTVRLPRIAGADTAIEWIAGAKQYKADAALKVNVVDAVVAPGDERQAAIDTVKAAIAGDFDWAARNAEKKAPLQLSPIESAMVFGTSIPFVQGKAGPNYPAPVRAIKGMKKASTKGRDEALAIEADGFADMAQTTVASALIGLFLNDQYIKGLAKKHGKIARPVKKAAVLGAGIMGGGIAYQSALKDIPIIMKDINQDGLDLGLGEAAKLLEKQVSRKKIKPARMAEVLNNIDPALSYGDFADVDILVEAVVENPKVKKMVLAEVEGVVREDTIITSNTSSISIDLLAEDLKRPENFLGMHFFNPVHRMPLVEIIRGEKTSKEAIATTVDYATKMGKTAIVVGDCPGFLVNRVLFPYFAGFQALMNDGGDFVKIDKVMEKFGWPMGPAYLLDVVGMDTAHHVGDVLAEGFPTRMAKSARTTLDIMYEAERFGQKNDKGYYKYELDRKGKPKKTVDPDVAGLLHSVTGDLKDFDEEEIIDRLMLPMIIETARCLEEGIVDSVQEADMALIMGIGFPPFRGGAFKYADTVGIKTIVEKADKYADVAPVYEVTERMREMAANGETYYK